MYFDLIKLCLCVALNIPIKLCMFRHGNNVYFELTIPSFYIGHDMRNCFTCTRQTKVAQGTPPQRMPPNRFPETHFGLFTGPRCLWGPVYGSRSLYVRTAVL